MEIASVDIVDGQITNPMSHLVRPDRPISPGHKFTVSPKMVADKPGLKRFCRITSAAGGMSPTTPASIAGCYRKCRREWICTMKMARRLYAVNTAIWGSINRVSSSVATPAGLHHHRALYDCYITAALLLDIINVSGWQPRRWRPLPVVRRC